jgi:hypothetical protein
MLSIAEIMRYTWLWDFARLFNAVYVKVMGGKWHTTGVDTSPSGSGCRCEWYCLQTECHETSPCCLMNRIPDLEYFVTCVNEIPNL